MILEFARCREARKYTPSLGDAGPEYRVLPTPHVDLRMFLEYLFFLKPKSGKVWYSIAEHNLTTAVFHGLV